MQYEGTTYRPPPEADTPLLQVSVGCAHNQFTFCDMYRDVTFRRIPNNAYCFNRRYKYVTTIQAGQHAGTI